MKINKILNARGLGIIWNGQSRTLVIVMLLWGWSFYFPPVGFCQKCGHHWKAHIARRDAKAIQWRCLHITDQVNGLLCDCEHYQPIVKGIS